MNFQVPQFIEIEDTIFGPLTFKQFIYLVGGGAVVFLLWTFLPSYIALLPMIIVAVLSLALAFYKVNQRPFIKILEASFWYILSKKLYIWKKDTTKMVPKTVEMAKTKEAVIEIPKLSRSKLRDLSWSLDIKDNLE